MPQLVSRCGAWIVLGAILAIAGSPSAGAQGIERIPAFGADEFLSLPARNWITNGGKVIAGFTGGEYAVRGRK